MKFGTKVLITRGGSALPGFPGCRRVVRGILIGARGHQRAVRLEEDDPFDTVGWNKKGMIGWWAASMIESAEVVGGK